MSIVRRKKALKKILENRGKKTSVSKAMRDSGYSDAYSKNPQQFTKTKGWNEIMDSVMPLDKLGKIHKEILGAYTLDMFVFPMTMEDPDIKQMIESIHGCKLKKIEHGETQKRAYYFIPDNKARMAALDMAYKLRGKYTAEKKNPGDPLSELSDDELDDLISKHEKELENKRYQGTAKKK